MIEGVADAATEEVAAGDVFGACGGDWDGAPVVAGGDAAELTIAGPGAGAEVAAWRVSVA